jgi:CheY-like chemotaxis protein
MHTILLAEDSEDDVFLVNRALREINAPCLLQAVGDGMQVINYLSAAGDFASRQLVPLPSFLLLDIKLPHLNGFEVLEWIRRDAVASDLPVAMFTVCHHMADMNRAFDLGADAYFVKPNNQDRLVELLKSITQSWFRCGMFPAMPMSASVHAGRL